MIEELLKLIGQEESLIRAMSWSTARVAKSRRTEADLQTAYGWIHKCEGQTYALCRMNIAFLETVKLVSNCEANAFTKLYEAIGKIRSVQTLCDGRWALQIDLTRGEDYLNEEARLFREVMWTGAQSLDAQRECVRRTIDAANTAAAYWDLFQKERSVPSGWKSPNTVGSSILSKRTAHDTRTILSLERHRHREAGEGDHYGT